MKYYTKEWHKLSDYLSAVDGFEPIVDKDYTDEEIGRLYQDLLEKHLQEEQYIYDEPPRLDLEEWPEEFQEERKQEFLQELSEYENRAAFDTAEETEFFEECYRDALEDPDEDLPGWIRDAVDPRLIALEVLPESVYKRLREEEKEKQARFDELEVLCDRYEEEYEGSLPDGYELIEEALEEIQYEYITETATNGESYEMELVVYDDEGEQAKRKVCFSNAEMLENETPTIHLGEDEDGDIESDCEMIDYELYYADGKYEVHMLLDNDECGLKYVTLRCDNILAGDRT